jgi:hypothetical protein
MTQEQKALYDTEAALIVELNKQAEALAQQTGLLSKEQEMIVHLRNAMLQLQPEQGGIDVKWSYPMLCCYERSVTAYN